MQRAYGLQVPQSLEEVCDPHRLALIVYDMERNLDRRVEAVAPVTDAASQARLRTIIEVMASRLASAGDVWSGMLPQPLAPAVEKLAALR